ncbi:DUF4307 domain-containing protein [Leucobacter insecticola]|uniref:DUF4307 domain-containing protein n=1 Tax=Leucobacter insecticola TaxID=2714934 RepID=A0A6G8FHG0_9MICO|nr:DUF4307 domain-containing protein [Leucobacter insecticola]QIM15936.1 DUF4307 domain-containing protein [Leucobacter insecticola]
MSQADSSSSSAAAPTENDAPAAAQSLEDRYNTGRKRSFDRRFAWSAAGVLVLAGISFLFFSGWQDTNQVAAQDIGFTRTGDLSVVMKFEVTGPEQTPVACAVEALNTAKGTAGWTVVEVPVSDERTHVVSVPMNTTTEATAVSVRDCWVVK